MLFSKKINLVGLDIGSRVIKAGQVLDTKKGHSLVRFAMADIAPGIIEDGQVKNPTAGAQAIRDLWREHHFKDQNVAISVGGYSVIVKKIAVQSMSEEQLHETIQFEAEQYIPFDINEVNIDFQILGDSEGGANLMNVLLVAAKKEMVNDYINLVQMAGLNPCVIDVDAFALQNIYELNYRNVDENVALIDIGASKTSLNILKGMQSVFMRDVSLGCGQINQRIMSLIDCSPQEAERIKLTKRSESVSVADMSGIVTAVVTDWCNEIRRALDFFYSTYPEDQIKRILLSGGGARIEEFRDLLAADTSAEVETVQPFQAFEIEKDRFDGKFLDQAGPQAAICMGLAIRKVDDK
jgi:type IV pilus assembly protein PilM